MSSTGENTNTTCGTSTSATHMSTPVTSVNPALETSTRTMPMALPTQRERASKTKRVSSSSRKNKSKVWDHFTKIECKDMEKKKALCNYCGKVLGCDSKSGTTVLRNHSDRYKSSPSNEVEEEEEETHVEKRQKTLVFQQNLGDSSSGVAANSTAKHSSLVNWKFDQAKCKEFVAKMIIIDETPFRVVEHEGCCQMMRTV